MTIVSSSSQSSPVFFTHGHQPPEGLWSHLQTAANTDRSLVTPQGTGIAPIDSKAAYLDLQKQAADSCFLDASLRNFVLSSAQKTNSYGKDASAVALMECAVNLHLLEAQGVDSQGLRDAKSALDDLAGKFQARPAWSLVTMDLKHKSRYEAYQKLTRQIDNLLSKNPAGTGEIFESIQLQLARDYLVDGLRAGVENRWGPLTAQSVRELMQHADLTPAAANTLDGQLKIAKAGGNGQTLGEFIRQTLKVLDLHRPGKFEAAAVDDPAAPQKPQIAECLHHCCGHSGGGGQPTITVKGAKAIANLDGMDKRLRAFIEKMFEDSEPGPVVRPALTTVGTNTEQGPPPLDNYFDMDPALFSGGDLYYTTSVENLPPPADDLPPPPPPPSELDDLEQFMYNGQPVSQVVQNLGIPYVDPFLYDSQVKLRDFETTETNLQDEPHGQSFPTENINAIRQFFYTEESVQLSDQIALRGVRLDVRKMPKPAPFHVMTGIVTLQNLRGLSSAIDLDSTASEDAKELKAMLKGPSPTWEKLGASETFQALWRSSEPLKKRIERLLEAELRGFSSADRNSLAFATLPDLTAGVNSHTYSQKYIS